MIDEEFSNHRCMPEIKGWMTMKYASCYTVKDEQNRKITTFRGMDGIVYDFVEIPEDKEYTKIPYQIPLSTEKKQVEESTEDEAEPKMRFCQIYVGSPLCQKSSVNLLFFAH